jgi:hypothetical protein
MHSRMSRPVNPPLGDPRMTGVWQRSAPSISASTPSTRKSKNAPAVQGGGSIDGSWDSGYGSNLVSINNDGFYINPNTNAQNCQPFLEDSAVNGDLQQRISDLRFRSDHLTGIQALLIRVSHLAIGSSFINVQRFPHLRIYIHSLSYF